MSLNFKNIRYYPMIKVNICKNYIKSLVYFAKSRFQKIQLGSRDIAIFLQCTCFLPSISLKTFLHKIKYTTDKFIYQKYSTNLLLQFTKDR